MKVKKLTVALAATAATALYASGADAFNLNQVTNGFVVTDVIHDGQTMTTTVGIVSRHKGTVYWVFFDEDSNHVVDGDFPVTANDYYPFIWAEKSGYGLEGVRGYLVFSLDIWPQDSDGNPKPDGKYIYKADDNNATDTLGLMSGNAFLVDISQNDVAFIPVIPITANAEYPNNTKVDPELSDYWFVGDHNSSAEVNLKYLEGADIISARYTGVDINDRMDLRYFVDNRIDSGTETWLAFWTADELPVSESLKGSWKALIYDTDQGRGSINIDIIHRNMNFVNVEEIQGRQPSFIEGFIVMDYPIKLYDETYWDPGLTAYGGLSKDSTGTPLPDDEVYRCAIPYIAEKLEGGPDESTQPYTYCWGGYLGYSIVYSPYFGAVQTLLGMHD